MTFPLSLLQFEHAVPQGAQFVAERAEVDAQLNQSFGHRSHLRVIHEVHRG